MSAPSEIPRDGVMDALGITAEEVSAGYARVSMTVSEATLNIYGTCHGGVLFTLADCALGHACNASGPLAVATGGDVNFLRPARIGDRLVAEARERHRTRRTALFEIEVRDAESKGLVATLSGRIAYPQLKST